MSILEQLRPFVSLCQACGMIPYTIEDNLITNKFSRFTFTFNHLTTWWFFLILVIFHPVVLVVMWYMTKDVPIHLLMGRNMPITVTVLLTVTAISYFVELFLSRWIVSRYRKLQHAIEAIQEVEKIFGEKFLSQHKSSIGYQIIIGFILVFIVAIGCLSVTIPANEAMLPIDIDIFLVTVVYSGMFLVYILFQCTFFLIYLCYYVVAHYVKLLLHADDVKDKKIILLKEKERSEILRRNVLIFNYLCRASQKLNDIFSVPVFILLTSKFISVVSVAFAYIYNKFIRTDFMLDNHSVAFLFWFVAAWIQILILLTAADMPANQVRHLRERVTAISSSGLSQSLTGKLTDMATLVLIDENRMCLSAAGLFKVGVHLMPTLAGAVVTYMVILLDS